VSLAERATRCATGQREIAGIRVGQTLIGGEVLFER
jgi:hypothetical protein